MRTRSLSPIITSPSPAATAVARRSRQPCSCDERAAHQPWITSSTVAATSPTLAAARGRRPGQPGQQQREQGREGRADHRPGGGQGSADGRPRRQDPALRLLGQDLGVLFRDPVHQQRDHHRDHQRIGRQPPADRSEERRGDNRAVDARGPAFPLLGCRPRLGGATGRDASHGRLPVGSAWIQPREQGELTAGFRRACASPVTSSAWRLLRHRTGLRYLAQWPHYARHCTGRPGRRRPHNRHHLSRPPTPT